MNISYIIAGLSFGLITAHSASAEVKIKNYDLNLPVTKQFPEVRSKAYFVEFENPLYGKNTIEVPLEGKEVTNNTMPSTGYTNIKVVDKNHKTLFTCVDEKGLTGATLRVNVYKNRCTVHAG